MVDAIYADPSQRAQHVGKQLIVDEFFALEDDGHKYELINGSVLALPFESFRSHARPAGRIFHAFNSYLNQNDVGSALFDVPVCLGPDQVLRPDLCVLLHANATMVNGHVTGIPAVVAEVVSEGTRDRDRRIKPEIYRRSGVKEVIFVDPDRGMLELWRNGGEHWQKRGGDFVESAVLPGLVIKAGALFPMVKAAH